MHLTRSDALSQTASELEESDYDGSKSGGTTAFSLYTSYPPASSCLSTAVTHCLPPRLSTALAAIDYEFPPYHDCQHDFPNPGLVISGLSEPLALPLVPAQATQLTTLATMFTKDGRAGADEGVTECVEVLPDILKCENPDWDDAVDELLDTLCFYLGLWKDSVKCELYGLVLYRSGGPFRAQVNKKTSNGVFALTIQLPSCFSGGEVINRYNSE